MLTIACVLRSGGIYDPAWVARLQRNVAGFAPPHRFVCLTDETFTGPYRGINQIRLAHDWPGWWSKIELWRPGLFGGRVLYLDLDCLVTGDLAALAAGSGFRICDDWWLPGFNSSVMAWDGGDCGLYQEFDPALMQRLHGDQDWITKARPDAQTFDPGLVVSYKAHCRPPGGSERSEATLPINARVVAFHGRPKPDEVKEKWIVDAWNS